MRSRTQLRHLNSFVVIVEEGTLTAAAARLHRSQGAVSQDLAALEDNLGLLLIDRSGQHVKLTPAGEMLLPNARDILRRVRDAEESMRRLRNGEAGVLRIGMLPTLMERVTLYVEEFYRSRKDVRVEITRQLQVPLIDNLITGEIDVAIAMPTGRSEVKCLVVESEALVAVLPSNHPLSRLEQVTAGMLADVPFISLGADVFSGTLGYFPTPVFEVDDYRIAQLLIRRGVGFSVLPRSVMVGSEGLIGVATSPALRRQLSVIVGNRQVPALVKEFHEFITSSWGKY